MSERDKEIEKGLREAAARACRCCANCGFNPSDPQHKACPVQLADIAFYSVQVHGPRNLMGSMSIPLCNRCAWLMRDEALNACAKFTKETADGKRPEPSTPGKHI